jgi:mycothiol synthase
VIELRAALPAAEVDAALQLADDAMSADGVAPLSEQVLLRLEDPRRGVHHLVARNSHGALVGYAQLDREATAEVVVAPATRRQGIGTALVKALEAAAGGGLHVWAHGEHPGALALAERLGYRRARVLLQLRRSLTQPLPDPKWPADTTVRTFVPGADEAAWLQVNNAAFASHPEQGGWQLHDIEQREAKPWFDPLGFFLAERGGELIGFHWTKVHTDESPPVGEVYVVGVRPEDSGHGLGPALTLAGLRYLRSRGLGHVLLYVDESNVPAVKTYERLGFTRWAVDVLYAPPDVTNAQ